MNRTTILSRYALASLLLFILGVSSPAQAQQKSSRWTAAEIAGLPQYCQDRMSGDRDRIQKWRNDFGHENLIHLHHFCNGLIYFSRARIEIDSTRRRRNAINGISQFNYVLQRWPANFQLYKQAQMYKNLLEMMSK